jgi:FkbM family methyltransferase
MSNAPLAALSLYLRHFPWHSGRWRLIPVGLRWCQKAFQSTDPSTIRTRHGFRLRVDRSDWLGRHIYVTGEYEPGTTRIFKKLLRRGDTAIDIGANIGYFTLLAGRCVGDSGKVIAFEPIAEVRRQLEENVRLSGLKNTIIRSEAVFSESGTRDFFQGPTDHVGVSSLRTLDDCSGIRRVTTVRLDDVLADEPKITLIKLDVEGAECHALEGMVSCLERHRPDLIVEITDRYLQSMGRSAEQLYKLLGQFGYRAYLVGDDDLVPLGDGTVGPQQFNALITVRPDLSGIL